MKAEFQKMMDLLHKESGVVGAVAAIFKDEQIIFMDKYGMADKEEGREMTLTCSFDIASCSKAWTVMLCAQAVDEGLIGWDQPIKDIIPEFDMQDHYAGAHLTIRDMACHRSGLPCHDFMRNKVAGSRENMMKKCAQLEATEQFRSAYQYNNHMYIVLGYLLERLYGESWESLIKRKIADPLGVTDIRFRGQKGNMDNLERALPYGGTGFDAFRCNYSDSPISGPCGGIKVNLPNLLKWVMAMARGGVCESGKRLCSEKQYQEMITSLIPCTGNTHGFNGSCYAMAWHTGVYNNQPIVFHSGGLTGFTTQVGFLPGKNCGYAMIFNTGSTPASETIRRMALDLLTAGQLNEDHYIEVIDDWKVARDKMVESVNKAKGTPCTAVSDPQLIGSYEHPAYEVFDIAEKDGGLWFLYGDFKAPIVRNAEGKLSAYEKTLDGLAPDHVDLEEVDGGLKLHDSDSALWMSFKKIC